MVEQILYCLSKNHDMIFISYIHFCSKKSIERIEQRTSCHRTSFQISYAFNRTSSEHIILLKIPIWPIKKLYPTFRRPLMTPKLLETSRNADVLIASHKLIKINNIDQKL